MNENEPQIASSAGSLAALAEELAAEGFDEATEVGRGGFGVVLRCHQSALDRIVAVKVLTSTLGGENHERFLREENAMGKLSGHPNIATVFQVGTTSVGRPYIVMPFHPEGSLHDRIRAGPLDWRSAVQLGAKIAGALESAHRVGILHRDVKPGNILLSASGDPQLTDFGIAHVTGAFETASGVVIGSPAFAAPEVVRGGPSTQASDIYSLGATLFCAITGHAPFERRQGEDLVAHFIRIAADPLPHLSAGNLPTELTSLLERAMAPDVSTRLKSAADFKCQLLDLSRHYERFDECTEPNDVLRSKSTGWTTLWARNDKAVDQFPGVRADRQVSYAVRTSIAWKHDRGGNLPVDLTSFVGRRAELAQLKSALAASRLVTLLGPGGVGKTRLALRSAETTRRAFKGGTWLIELGDLRDGAFLPDFVARTVGPPENPRESVIERLVRHLLDREVLFVFDNCEHIIGPVATLADSLLRKIPGLRILATSREPLGINGENVLRIAPLKLPAVGAVPTVRSSSQYEALTLFVERATNAVPAFELSEQNIGTVFEICRKIDGLPLAIELATVRLRTLSLEQILDQLSDEFRLLAVGNRTAPSRQQTLKLCTDWSYQLCTALEQKVWARASVFAGGFELDAVEAVCMEGASRVTAMELVTSLVDKSVFVREEYEGGTRYHLLETLRDYGLGQLKDCHDYGRACRRHRDWCEALAAQAEAEWISGRQRNWISRIDREEPNFRVGLSNCLGETGGERIGQRITSALFPSWFSRGSFEEGQVWYRLVLSGSDEEPSIDRAKALYMASVVTGTRGEIAEATAQIDEADNIRRFLSTSDMSGIAGYATGCVALFCGDLVHAVSCFEAGVIDARQEDDRIREIGNMFGLAITYGLTGETQKALRFHQDIINATKDCGEVFYRGRSSWAAGVAVWRSGDGERAVALLREGLELTSQIDDPVGIARSLQALAWVAVDRRKWQRAAVLLGGAESLWQEVGTPAITFFDMQKFHTSAEQKTTAALGLSRFSELKKQGREISLRELIDFALEVQSRPNGRKSLEKHTTTLTRREMQVAELVAQGLTNRLIAAKLVISHRTAQGHVEHILSKLGFTSRAQIAGWIVERRTEE